MSIHVFENFCSIRRFPVHTLNGASGSRQASNRVAVNFIPSRLTLDLAGAPVSVSYTNHGPMGHFGLFFIGSSDQLFLSTAGTGRPFADFEVSDPLADRIQRILVEMAADPQRPLSSLDLLAGQERAELAEIGNQAVLTQPTAAPVSIPDMFAEQVAAAPDAAALTFEGRTLTYRELDEAANRLAHLLAAQGARPGERVALFSNRSARAVVGMLAILKTGAARLPIDPAVPTSRMEFILADAAPIGVVTTAKLRSGSTATAAS